LPSGSASDPAISRVAFGTFLVLAFLLAVTIAASNPCILLVEMLL
jgi:hypothetical protein